MPRGSRAKKNPRPRRSSGKSLAAQSIDVQKQTLLAVKEWNGVSPPTARDVMFPQLRRNKVYTFSRTYTAPTLTSSSTVDAPFTLNFTLASFPDSTEFTSLFDQYRIDAVRLLFTSIAALSGPSLSTKSVIHTVIDYDDSTPITVNGAFEYDSHQVNPVTSSFERSLRPRASLAAFSGVFTSFTLAPSQTWVDAASPSV